MNRPPVDLAAALDRWRRGEDPPATVLALADAMATDEADRDAWWRFLSATRHPDFLLALPDDGTRRQWAEVCFRVVEETGFHLGDLFAQRVEEQGTRTLFRDLADHGGESWSYDRVARRLRETAAVLVGAADTAAAEAPPRVAILAANGIGSACVDLACLTHGIFVCPLDIHFNADDLAWICKRVGVTTAVCDSAERLETLLAVRSRTGQPLRILTVGPWRPADHENVQRLDEQRTRLDPAAVADAVAALPRPQPRAPATVMFTSGSTGRPKGVVFTQLNLVSKRFARAAALPAVGRDEVLLCYLPLYHTFGRYLEMLGTIFWGGTYVFAGNPSADTLLHQMMDVRPTGLISVPVRWVQIRDRVLARQEEKPAADAADVFREVVGDRLAWGLSAAGWLDPRVFRYFHRHGVSLCSGFGMTEGTGGLTMTPPDNYEEESVGVPLPGVKVRFGEREELQIAGIYIARYLPPEDEAGSLAVDEPDHDDHWLATGDLFQQTPGGQLRIVDRVKDIYKNNRGQTIAPRKVESLFEGVPGIRRTFLAGDGRSYNTLLIVPDAQDEVLTSLADDGARREYFERIVTMANPGLAPYERIVDFAVVDRDFTVEQGELTPKGSFRRKAIEAHFAEEIADLYRSSVRVLTVDRWRVRIPRWLTRDLGVLDDSLVATDDGLVNRETGTRLAIGAGGEDRVRIGDLEYRLEGDVIELGLLVRQPLLWVANAQLIRFGPCRPGWDTACAPFADQVVRPDDPSPDAGDPRLSEGLGRDLAAVDRHCRSALFAPREEALAAITTLDRQLEHSGVRLGTVIRRRLEALARHPDQTVRSRAYQVLVLDEPVPDYQRYLPAFVASGLPFLDDESFTILSRALIEPRRLQALRQRLHSYRTQLDWPANERTRRVFQDLFRLLADFARNQPDFYGPVREELVIWTLHDADPVLARAAEAEFEALSASFEERLVAEDAGIDPAAWEGRIVFQEGLAEAEQIRLREILIGTTFLQESVMLAFEGERLELEKIGPGGIWVSRIISRFEDSRYRVSINTTGGKHFDLQLIVRQDIDREQVRDTIYWYIVLRGYPFGTPMLPKFGCCRPELGALSMGYVSDLTVWEKIREFSSVRGPGTPPPSRMRWHQLLVRAMTVVVKGWRNSGRRIIPGLVTPNNIVVPEPDFRRGSVQNNLTGWRPYESPLSLIRPLWRNIYQNTINHYPWTREYLERAWIFEAVAEALGPDKALVWLRELQAETTGSGAAELGPGFDETLAQFIDDLANRFYQPLALKAAIHRYDEWERVNVQAPLAARLEVLTELARLYRLTREPEIVRFTLFRHTYFRNADPRLLDVFERLLTRMFRHPHRPATRMVELSDLQAALTDADDRLAFGRLAFPDRLDAERVEVSTIGDPARDRVVVRSLIHDRQGTAYTVGEPSGPADVGQLYRIFVQAGFPMAVSGADRYFVVTDGAEQIVGGVIYRDHDGQGVFLDGVVVARTLVERGIAAATLEDFCTRMRALGRTHVKTHFFLRRFFERNGFRVDSRRGGLVRHLG